MSFWSAVAKTTECAVGHSSITAVITTVFGFTRVGEGVTQLNITFSYLLEILVNAKPSRA